MRKLLALLIFLSTPAYADLDNPLNFRESDGSPDTYPYQVNVSNGTLTDNGDGTITITTGGGGGDSVTVNGTAIDTTANFVDTASVTWTVVDGGAGGPDDIQATATGSGGVTAFGSPGLIQFISSDGTNISGDSTFQWFSESNTLVISRDGGQISVDAIIISSDTGATLWNVSHDGSMYVGGTLDVPGAGSNSLRIGRGSLAGGANSIAIGSQSNSGTGSSQTILGNRISIVNSASQAVVIGTDAKITANGDDNVLIGAFSTSNKTNTTCIGSACNTNGGNASIAIGYNTATTAANQMVIGSNANQITDVYISEGVTNASPLATAINATGGSGTNIAGAKLTLAGGKGTGNAAGGGLNLAVSARNASGSTLQSLVDVVQLNTTADTVTITPLNTSMVGLVIESETTQTADLTLWQNDGKARLASVSNDGSAFFNTLQLSTDLSAIDGGTGQGSYTKGDILVATGSSTLTKVSVGTNGQILSADSGQTSGVIWATQPRYFTITSGTEESATGNKEMSWGNIDSGSVGRLSFDTSVTCNGMMASVTNAPGDGKSFTISLGNQAATTDLSCTISGATGQTCSDFSSVGKWAAGEPYYASWVAAGTPTGTGNHGVIAFCYTD